MTLVKALNGEAPKSKAASIKFASSCFILGKMVSKQNGKAIKICAKINFSKPKLVMPKVTNNKTKPKEVTMSALMTGNWLTAMVTARVFLPRYKIPVAAMVAIMVATMEATTAINKVLPTAVMYSWVVNKST